MTSIDLIYEEIIEKYVEKLNTFYPKDVEECFKAIQKFVRINWKKLKSKSQFYHESSLINLDYKEFLQFLVKIMNDESNCEIKQFLDLSKYCEFCIQIFLAAFHYQALQFRCTKSRIIDSYFDRNGDIYDDRNEYDSDKENDENEDFKYEVDVKYFCQLSNHNSYIKLEKLKSNMCDKLVTIKGSVIRVNNIKPYCIQMAFECMKCKAILTKTLFNNTYALPKRCYTERCNSKLFNPLRSHRLTKTIDSQIIRIQEFSEDSDDNVSGRVPHSIDCYLLGPFADKLIPGDLVFISGILKVSQNLNQRFSNGTNIYDIYIELLNVVNFKDYYLAKQNEKLIASDSTIIPNDFDLSTKFLIDEVDLFQEMAKNEDSILKILVNSICPSIYGNHMVKLAIILTIFSGEHQAECNKLFSTTMRSNSHLLLVGDPGLGKSQLLTSASSIAPRSVYVCGNSTTQSGMTVTLNRDSTNQGDYSLEAGALVLSDQGICFIDELDKMHNQHASLLEAMEQQRISLAKAGIVCSLPARSSIIAACNPVSGHYNRDFSVSENIKMMPALLSRFDLIFLMLDKKSDAFDQSLSKHIVDIHSKTKTSFSQSSRICRSLSNNLNENEELIFSQILLSEEEERDFEALPALIFKKFIEFSKSTLLTSSPKLSDEASKAIQEYYLKMRKISCNEFATPITTRFLESLIRLSKARARISHSKLVTYSHAKLIIALMDESINAIFRDSSGKNDFSRSQQSCGMSAKSKWKRFIAYLTNRSELQNKKLFAYQEMLEVAKEAKVDTFDFANFIDTLNNQGFILKKGKNMYQLQTI